MYGIDENDKDLVIIKFLEEGGWNMFFLDWKFDKKIDGAAEDNVSPDQDQKQGDGVEEDMGFGLFD